MKKAIALTLILCSVLAACTPVQPDVTIPTTGAPASTTTQPDVTTQPTTDTTIPAVTYHAPLVAFSAPTTTEEINSENGTKVFSYTSQNFSLIHPDPEAANAVTLDLLNQVDFSNSAAKDVYDSAMQAYSPDTEWTPYFYSELYTPTRLDNVMLSLYGTETLFDGSPRSTAVSIALNYDLLTGTLLEELTQVLSAEYSAETLCKLITDDLAPLASEGNLYADYEAIIADIFATNAPVKNWYFSRDGLCFFFMPYEIAPYTTGTIVVDIPYSDLNGLIKDQYFPAEIAELYGSAILSRYDDTIQIEQIAELVLEKDGQKFFLRTDGTLFNLQISMLAAQNSDEGLSQDHPVFAAASISAGDGVIIQCSEAALSRLQLTYQASGATSTQLLSDIFA